MSDRAEVQSYVRQFDTFLDASETARHMAERDRDYKDGKQWTSEEAQVLLSRKQAPIVINRIAPKVDFMLGVERSTRTDPKALPRTPGHEKDAEAVTDALRFIADKERFDQCKSIAFEEMVVEGIGAVLIGFDNGEVELTQVHWDRFYYDPHSRENDFSDATYMGLTTWMHINDAKQMFSDMAEELGRMASQEVHSETYDDRPRWYDSRNSKDNPRIRINQHYFKKEGVWHQVYYTQDLILIEPEPSQYVDEDGEALCPIVAVSAFVDRDNNRYGAIRHMIHVQDEINHRRSKALHAMSNVTLISEKGALENPTRVLDQLASGKAHVELLDGDARLEVDRNNELAQGQLFMLQEAKQEIDAVGANAALAGKDEGAASGRAIQAKQEGGLQELGPLYDRINDWQRRVFEQVWMRIRQYWTAERWVRVTDDENNIRWVGLNRPETGRDILADRMSIEPEQAEAALEAQGIPVPFDLDQQTGGVVTQLSELEVDLIVSEAPDVATLQQETFQTLAQLAASYPNDVTFTDVVELSPLRSELKEKFLQRKQQAGQSQEEALQAQMAQQQQALETQQQSQQADTAAKLAKARKDNADADAQTIENGIVQRQLEFLGA